MPAEVTFDRLHLFISDPDVFDIPEGFPVFGPADVFHEGLVTPSDELLDFEVIDEVDLRFPTALFEGALTDVIVVVGARKGEVLGQ